MITLLNLLPPTEYGLPLVSMSLAIVAFSYAVVGHAGASGYIAVFALANASPEQIKPVALMLNLIVASVGCWNFLRAGHLPLREIWPVYILSLPMALLGGWLNLPGQWFRPIVGVVLLLSAWRLGTELEDPSTLSRPSRSILLLTGGGLGLLAGITGTGGGVFLTPLMLIFRWCSTREASAVSVLFILMNSAAGLTGWSLAHIDGLGQPITQNLSSWILIVLISGTIGSRLGSRHWPVTWIRRCLALVLIFAAVKLMGLIPIALGN